MRAGVINHESSLAHQSLSAHKRGQMAHWRAALQRREVTLAELFEERPACLGHRSLIDLCSWGYRWGVKRASKLNELAINQGINLAVPLDEAPKRTMEWLVKVLGGPIVEPRPVVVPLAETQPEEPGGGRVPVEPFRDWLAAEYARERQQVLAEFPPVTNHWTERTIERETRCRLSSRLGLSPRTLYDHMNGVRRYVYIDTVDRVCGPLLLNELYPPE